MIVRGKQNKQNRNWFYFNLSFESSSFIFNNFKTEEYKLTFEGWNRPVCNLFGSTRVSFCQNCISPSNSEANRDGADLLFCCFFLFLPHLRTLAQEKRSEIVFVLGLVGGVSVSIHYWSLLSRNIWILFPTLTMATRAKKKDSGKAICPRHQRESALSRFGARVRYWISLRGSASYVVNELLFQVGVYFFQSEKTSVQVSVVPKMTVFLYRFKMIIIPVKKYLFHENLLNIENTVHSSSHRERHNIISQKEMQ